MTQLYRWLACDGYTIELNDGHRVLLQDLHPLRPPLPPLHRLGRTIGRWLLGPLEPEEAPDFGTRGLTGAVPAPSR